MLHKKKKIINMLDFSIFVGIIPASFSGIIFSEVKNLNSRKISSNEMPIFSSETLKFKNQNGKELFVSLRSNPMNNFVYLATNNIETGDITEQFTYVLCDTSTSPGKTKYGKNSGIAKFDYDGNIVALWTLPNVDRDKENEYIYTTNIVFGDNEDTLYVLCGISNPAAALNSVYGGANVPSKICFEKDYNLSNFDGDTAYFFRNNIPNGSTLVVDEENRYNVNISNYSFLNYPKIKIYKLNSKDLEQLDKYDFEFPPAATGKLNESSTASDEYDRIIIAGFGGGQHLNYWTSGSTWITDYVYKPYKKTSFMNSSFFHYLQYGQTFDYVDKEQFMMVPKYIGIDPNLGGLYSIVNEELTGSLASLSNYPSLYHVLYNHKGKPGVNSTAQVLDFNIPRVNPLPYQYQYLNGLGKKVDVTDDSEFVLKESVINLILLSIGYFYPNRVWSYDFGTDMKNSTNSVPGWLLGTYGIICFSPKKQSTIDKYKLYVFNKDHSYSFTVNTFSIQNVFIDKDMYGVKRYRYFLREVSSSSFPDCSDDYYNFYNTDGRDAIILCTRDVHNYSYPLGVTWKQFESAYECIEYSQSFNTGEVISLTGINQNSNSWLKTVRTSYFNNLKSILTVKEYDSNKESPLGWYSEWGFMKKPYVEIKNFFFNHKSYHSAFPSSSGSKYINYGNKILISDPNLLNRLVVITSKDGIGESLKKHYDNSYEYASYAKSVNSYNRIGTLFTFPRYEGFGYLTYKNHLKICSLSEKQLVDQLTSKDFNSLNFFNDSSIFQSAIPVGKMLFTSVLNANNTVSNGYFDLKNILSKNDATIWVIIGSCIAAAMFIALGLGIGIPMRKNAKLQLATTKLANKKIDMLSTTVAKSFRKLTDNTNAILKNQPRILSSASIMRQQAQLTKPTVKRPKSISPLRTINPNKRQ